MKSQQNEKSVAGDLVKLAKLQEQFNDQNTHLENHIRQLNQQLAATGIAMEFYIESPLRETGFISGREPGEATETRAYLGWHRLAPGEDWQLAIKEITNEYQDLNDDEKLPTTSENYIPLIEAPIKDQRKAYRAFAYFVEQFTKHAASQVADLASLKSEEAA